MSRFAISMLNAVFSGIGAAFGSGSPDSSTDLPYLPLITGLNEIRLLELRTGRSADLHNVPLKSAPSYHALSYAWGDPKPVAPYAVSGKKILVPLSLSRALERAFSFLSAAQGAGRIYVWADAICIDQGNKTEKAAQVALMDQIYRGASKVVVYLGEDRTWQQQNSGEAMRIIRAWGDWHRGFERQKYWRDYDGIFDYEYNMTESESRDRKRDHFRKLPGLADGSAARHLETFFSRPWWNRIWTLQELFYAREAVVLCDKHCVAWSTIVKAAQLWRDVEAMHAYCRYDDVEVVSRIFAGGLAAKTAIDRSVGGAGGGFRWLSMLAATTNFASTDPRDKLYALASMSSQETAGFEVSYTKPEGEVFRDFARRLLLDEENPDLELLQLAGVNHEPHLNPLGLPSWIPNFTNLDHPVLRYFEKLANNHYASHMVNSFRVWSASSSIRASLEPPGSSACEFRPRGIRIATVDDVCAPRPEFDGDPGWLRLALGRFGAEYKPPTPAPGEMRCHILQAYFRVLLGDRYESANRRLPEFEGRAALAGTFWHVFRGPFAAHLQEMDFSDFAEVGIDEILLGGGESKQGQQEQGGNTGTYSSSSGSSRRPAVVAEPGVHVNELITIALDRFHSFHFFVTENGYMGYGPECRQGDVVCVIFGCSVPLILRPRENGFIIVGQCFVLGIMNGELCVGGSQEDVNGIYGAEVFDIL